MTRVTQRSMYTNMMGSMQSTLSDYMESITQGASQKKLNRPSDDPAGAARVLSYRASLTRTNQHISNTDTAKGWLDQGTSSLDQASAVIISLREKAEQVASGTLSAEQRLIVANEMRQLMGSLMNMANVTHEGKHIFSGEQYDKAAYQEGLAADLHNPGKLEGASGPNLPYPPMQVTGTLSRTAMVRFSRSGTIPPEAGEEPMEYQWSEDGGTTWKVGTIKEEQNYFDVGGARITIPTGTPYSGNNMSVVKGYNLTPGDPTAVPPIPDKRADAMQLENGSTIKIRPTMIYQGSDNGASANVSRYGTIPLSSSLVFDAVGQFPNDMLIRFDDDVTMTEEMLRAVPPKSFSYSYSPDGGITWITGNSASVTQAFDPSQPPLLSSSGFGPDVKVISNVTSGDVQVRMENDVDLNAVPPVPVEYSYSTDGGKTWLTGTGPVTPQEVFDQPGILPGGGLSNDIKISSDNLTGNVDVEFTDPAPGVEIVDGAVANVNVTDRNGIVTPGTVTFAKDAKGNMVGTIAPPPAEGNVTFTLPAGKTAALSQGNTVNLTANSHTEASLPVPGGDIKLTAPVGATGATVTAGASVSSEPQGTGTARLVLPGGFLDVKVFDRTNGDVLISKNSQLSLQPQRSSLSFEILEDQYLSVNSSGKDIFGGLFTPKSGNGFLEPAVGTGKDSNLFETIGKLIAACETDNRDEIGQALAEIEDCQKNLLYHDTAMGGKINRLNTTLMVLDDMKINQSERKSAIEDVDFTELMTNLTQQQIAYNTVLKSSSMIMQMNLTKFM